MLEGRQEVGCVFLNHNSSSQNEVGTRMPSHQVRWDRKRHELRECTIVTNAIKVNGKNW